MDITGKGKICWGENEETEGQSKKSSRRHSPHQLKMLEEFFKQCPLPSENERQELSKKLGLEPKQIQFWFQNKRAKSKAVKEKETMNGLKAENERIHIQNLAMREELKNLKCPPCEGECLKKNERKRLSKILLPDTIRRTNFSSKFGMLHGDGSKRLSLYDIFGEDGSTSSSSTEQNAKKMIKFL